MTRLEGLAARVTAGWTRLYTSGLPAQVRDRRRVEVGSDVHGQLADARSLGERPARTAAAMLSRLVRGSWHDLAWRHEAGGPVRAARWQARRGRWLVGAMAITFLAGAVSIGLGTALRHGAVRAPSHLATAAAGQLAAGSRPASVLPLVVDIASSQAPFVMVFDPVHHVLASSGRLGGRIPALPDGVLAWTAQHGTSSITWEPRPGLREAAIIEPFGGAHPGFVLAAQSLRGITGRQRVLLLITAACWLVALAVMLLLVRQLPARAGRSSMRA